MSDDPAPIPPPDPAPTPLPPNTTPTRFWESSGAKVAVALTVALLLRLVDPQVVRLAATLTGGDGAGFDILFDGAVWGWLAAFGIQRTDTSSLRWR